MIKKMVKLFYLILIVVLLTGCPGEINHLGEVYDPTVIPRPNVAVLVTEGFHDEEVYMTMGYLSNYGMDITVIGPQTSTVKAYNSDFTLNIQRSVNNISVDEFDGLILPGGTAPSVLREDPAIVEFVKEFFESEKPVAAICHGPQILAAANVLEGRTCTGVSSIQAELEQAGAVYKDEAVVIDRNLITSRTPPDLFVFSRAIFNAVTSSFRFCC